MLSPRARALEARLARWAPRLHRLLRLAALRAIAEWRVLRRLRWSDLGPARAWQDELPVQSAPRVALPSVEVASSAELTTWLRDRRIPFSEGGHATYLPPESLRHEAFAALAERYPPDAGVKISKNPGPARGTPYLHGTHHSSLQRSLLHDHRTLGLVAAALHLEGVGPRPYDVVDLALGSREATFAGHVVRHVAGRAPTAEECADGLRRLQDLERRRVVRLVAPGGFEHEDFRPPDCGGNAVVGEDGFSYVDFQNFVLEDPTPRLEEIARDAATATHFGDTSVLRGGRYLYQSVPGLPLPGKRDTRRRGEVLEGLLADAGVDVRDRLVLDVGCNVGMMASQYLRMGAAWCHGWDDPRVVPHAERLLLSIGCTRFSLTGARLDAGRPVEDDLPSFLARRTEGCVVSYLAIRGHVGWLRSLARIGWSALVYEGHEGESSADFEEHVRELAGLTPVRVLAVTTLVDGDSAPRVLAVLGRGSR